MQHCLFRDCKRGWLTLFLRMGEVRRSNSVLAACSSEVQVQTLVMTSSSHWALQERPVGLNTIAPHSTCIH